MKSPEARQLIEIREHWFKNHVAELKEFEPNLARLKWSQPGTGVHAVRYVLDHGTLMVWGDLGEAVYQWGQHDITFDWLAHVELEYFHRKCQASEMGREFYDFDPAGVRARIREFIADGAKLDLDENQIDAIECEHSATAAITGLPIEGESMGDLLRGGKCIHLRCAAHWIGLQFYLDLNTGGTVHANEELTRVRELLAQETGGGAKS